MPDAPAPPAPSAAVEEAAVAAVDGAAGGPQVPLTVAEAKKQLADAVTALENGKQEVIRLEKALKAGDTRITAEVYASAKGSIEFLQLSIKGAEHRLAGARKLDSERREAQLRDRHARALVEAASAVLELAASAPPILAAVEKALKPCEDISPEWLRTLVHLRGNLHQLIGGGPVGLQARTDEWHAREELARLAARGYTPDQLDTDSIDTVRKDDSSS